MNEAEFRKLAKEFKEDTGHCAPGEDNAGPNFLDNELWRAWCKGRARGLEEVRP